MLGGVTVNQGFLNQGLTDWTEVLIHSAQGLCWLVWGARKHSDQYCLVSSRLLGNIQKPWMRMSFKKYSLSWERKSEVAQSCSTLCDPMDYSPPGSSIHGIFQARVLEQVAFPFSRGSSRPRDQTWVSCIAGRHFTIWATREALPYHIKYQITV